MEIRQASEQNITTVQLLGRLDELSVSEVEQAFSRMIREGASQMLLDLTRVEYISSSGLRVLLMLSRSLTKSNGRLKVAGLSPFVAEVFEISNFARLFDIYPNKTAALDAFSQGA